jgi:hypothetical protein
VDNPPVHACSFQSAPDVTRRTTYAEVKTAVLAAGRFSTFEADANKHAARLFTQLCSDPTVETFDMGYPWTGVRRRVGLDLPILFSTPMVPPILADRKLQTRRTSKLSGINKNPRDWRFVGMEGRDATFGHVRRQKALAFITCPYGQPGDTLWVREAWKSLAYGPSFGAEVHYRADGHNPEGPWADREKHRRIIDPVPDRDDRYRPVKFGPWKPGIHMPKWAARIWLEVTGVRVERLHDITEADAKAEGVESAGDVYSQPGKLVESYRRGFEYLWGQINGAESWDANPWVWVVEFKRTERKAVAA